MILVKCLCFFVVATAISGSLARGQELIGSCVTPHFQSTEMRWRRPPSPELAARVELYLMNNDSLPKRLGKDQVLLFDENSPNTLLENGSWAWHDTPHSWLHQSVDLPPECLTVIAFNGKSKAWGVGTEHTLQLDANQERQTFTIDSPEAWLSAVTFLSVDAAGQLTDSVHPNQISVHIQNAGKRKLRIESLRLWLPVEQETRQVFRLSTQALELQRFPSDGEIDGPGKAGFVAVCGQLPLGYAVLEVRVVFDGQQAQSLWGHLRIKRERFDISGGWVASDVRGKNTLTMEEYLKTLMRMHVNTGQIEEVAGYTDNTELYTRYPIKRFNRMQDLTRYDSEAMLPMIHAVEFIGEPQYGGGKPIAPQQVWELLAPYQASRLPTSVTLSEERNWRYYAGLSDYPHYDAYRVIAPAADAWNNYDRWDGKRIRWGAPLETIGDMTRSLRELSRPRPIAYWSQGAHDGWGGPFSSRRGSPTPDELRSQAWHGLANRVTSLYWFNLSLKSLLKFPDLIDPITRVDREARLLEEIILYGDSYGHQRVEADGKISWDLNTLASPNAAVLVAHDLEYHPDLAKNIFQFEPRSAELDFVVPRWLGATPKVFALDADGPHDVSFRLKDGRVTIQDQIHVVGIYVVTIDPSLRQKLSDKHAALIELEQQLAFDPAGNEGDLETLRALVRP